MVSAQIIWQSGPIFRGGRKDDLLTSGFGLEGLQNSVLPDDVTPRAAAIHKDFRDLVDVSPSGGYAPHVIGDPENLRVSGREYSALLKLPGRKYPFSVMVLVPEDFDWDQPVLVVAPSSGSRGVSGAIGDVGSWTLPQRCALVLTDKGTGCGAQVLDSDESYGPDYTATTDPQVLTNFRLKDSWSLRRFRRQHPGGVALKHAHSTENVEADWPIMVLEAAKFGLSVLNERERSTSRNGSQPEIKIMAVGVSNGGGAVLRAAEIDSCGIIDAVVAVEPNITPNNLNGSSIVVRGVETVSPGLSLIDYATLMAIFHPCTLLSSEMSNHPYAELSAQNEERYLAWAKKLAKLGILEGSSTAELAADAQRRTRALGFGQESEPLSHMMAMMHIWPTISLTFANAYGRFRVQDTLAGAIFSFATTDETGFNLIETRKGTDEERRLYAALGGGLSPGGGVYTVFNGNSVQPSVDDTLFLRGLVTCNSQNAKRVRRGAAQVKASARSRGYPTIILHGRCDSLINPTHTSRAYYAAAQASDTETHQWRYYEVDHAQHFETLLMMPGLSERFTPWLPPFFQALELMRDHLFKGAHLPPSQTLRSSLPNQIDKTGLAIRDGKDFASILGIPEADEIKCSGTTLLIP